MSKKKGCASDKIRKYRIRRKKDHPIWSSPGSPKGLAGTYVKDWNGRIYNFGTKQEAIETLKASAIKGTTHYYEIVSVCVKR